MSRIPQSFIDDLMARVDIAEVVGERDRLGEILVQPQGPGDGPRDLRPFQRVGEPVPVVVTLVVDEHLGLVLEAPESLGVNDPIPVTLESGPVRSRKLRMLPAPRVDCLRR